MSCLAWASDVLLVLAVSATSPLLPLRLLLRFVLLLLLLLLLRFIRFLASVSILVVFDDLMRCIFSLLLLCFSFRCVKLIFVLRNASLNKSSCVYRSNSESIYIYRNICDDDVVVYAFRFCFIKASNRRFATSFFFVVSSFKSCFFFFTITINTHTVYYVIFLLFFFFYFNK